MPKLLYSDLILLWEPINFPPPNPCEGEPKIILTITGQKAFGLNPGTHVICPSFYSRSNGEHWDYSNSNWKLSLGHNNNSFNSLILYIIGNNWYSVSVNKRVFFMFHFQFIYSSYFATTQDSGILPYLTNLFVQYSKGTGSPVYYSSNIDRSPTWTKYNVPPHSVVKTGNGGVIRNDIFGYFNLPKVNLSVT